MRQLSRRAAGLSSPPGSGCRASRESGNAGLVDVGMPAMMAAMMGDQGMAG
jgi:hypothetical protein